MACGKDLLNKYRAKRIRAIDTRATKEKLTSLGIPEPDHAEGFDPDRPSEFLIQFSYDIGGGFKVGFDIGHDIALGINYIDTPDELFIWDDIKQGWKAVTGAHEHRLRAEMPELTDHHRYVLSWLLFVDQSIRREM